jgi:hypothetical protein
VKKDGNGCVARASSTDLLHWRDEGIAYGFNAWNQCESSNVQPRGDDWLLFFRRAPCLELCGSDNPLRWPDVAPTKLRADITGMEVIRRAGDRWLVAYFGLRYYRLLVGVLDWSAAEPTIVQLTDPAGLKEFGL